MKYLLYVFALGVFAWAQPTVWTAQRLVRVGLADQPSSSSSVAVYGAMGEDVSFQVVATAGSQPLTNVNLTLSSLAGPAGATIPASAITLYREYYVTVDKSSPDWGTGNRPLPPGKYADALIPFTDSAGAPLSGPIKAVPCTVAAKTNQPFWVDIGVPRGIAAGTYWGTATITSDQGSGTASVSLTVWPFTLPLSPSLRTSFGLRGANLSKANEQVALQHRIMPISVSSSDATDLINRLGLNSAALWLTSNATGKTCTMDAPPPLATFQSANAAFPSSIFRYFYVADEIDKCTALWTTLMQWTRLAHQAGVVTLATITPTSSLYDDGTGRPAIDTWVLTALMYQAAGTSINDVLQKGNTIWSYTAQVEDALSPKWEIDFAPANYRVLPGMMNQSLGFKGTLYWEMDQWSSDPWSNVYAFFLGTYNYPGEGFLVYPGGAVGSSTVVPSIRLKWIRDGVNDYEYVEMLKARGQGAWAMQMVRTVATDFNNWSSDPNLFESVRLSLGKELAVPGSQSGSTTPAPSPGPTVSTAPAAPSSPYPASGAVTVPLTLTTAWAGPSTGVTYQVYAGTSSTSLSLFATVTTPRFVAPTLSRSTKYYWKVVASNASGSTSSPVWSFTTTN